MCRVGGTPARGAFGDGHSGAGRSLKLRICGPSGRTRVETVARTSATASQTNKVTIGRPVSLPSK